MQKLQSWIESHVKAFNGKPIKAMSDMYFHRTEHNAIVSDDRVFLSPAYGVVIGNCETNIDSEESIINAKGVNYTLKQMVGNDKETVNYLNKFKTVKVIDIFMSYYDIHTNHTPYNSIQQRFKQLQPLTTANAPMIKTEEAIFNGDLVSALGYTRDYLVNNQRAITQFYNSDINRRFFTIQLADDVVDCIINYNEHKDQKLLLTGSRFGQIRMGSGCSLIIPCEVKDEYKDIIEDINVESLVEVGDHIDGGVDAVFKISKLNGKTINEEIDASYNEEITTETYYDKSDDVFDDNTEDDVLDELDKLEEHN